MNEQELCKKRLIDLSKQANMKEIVTFSDFLNLNELNIYHNNKKLFYSESRAFGGYEKAERQMIAFIPDALCYAWEYPISCIRIEPLYPKYAEKLSHRDVLGALMHLGIERSCLGDIVCNDQCYYVFADEMITAFIVENLIQIRHTMIKRTVIDSPAELEVNPDFEERMEMIASNRIDCIIAKAYHFSRSQASEYLMSEKVFIDGKCITNCNQSCHDGTIISVRGNGRFQFRTNDEMSKKGKLKVRFLIYK